MLFANQADTQFVSVQMNEGLAEKIWQELAAKEETSWSHWREPYEQSEGLLLEYVHLLTQGDRLTTVIEEQVLQREHEARLRRTCHYQGYSRAVCLWRRGRCSTTVSIAGIESGCRQQLDEATYCQSAIEY